jgi:hypothetical protein
LSCLSHILGGFAWRRRFLRRRFAGRSFFHSCGGRMCDFNSQPLLSC